MYVLVIGRSFPDVNTGMMGIFEFEQAVALNKFGFRSVYAFCDNRSIKSLRVVNYVNFESNDIPIYGYHVPVGGLPRKLFDSIKAILFNSLLKKIIKDQGIPSIIHVHFPLINLNEKIWSLLKSLKVPIVVTEHWSKVLLKTIEPYRVELLKKIVKETDSFNCVGHQLKKSVEELTKTNKNIEVIPNMIQPIFNYERKKKRSNRFDFISIGRLVDSKRFDLLIEAFSKAFSDKKNVYLNIVGDGPLYKELKIKIEKLDMEDRIIMHGFLKREKTAEMLKETDAYVSASIIETFGVPFIEAMACGKPVIGIKDSAINSYINNTNGILFNKDDLNDLTNSLIKLYKNRNNYNGKNISNKTMEIFGEKTITTKIVDIYNELLNKVN